MQVKKWCWKRCSWAFSSSGRFSGGRKTRAGGLWIARDGCFEYPSHTKPPVAHRRQTGFASSHFLRRFLLAGVRLAAGSKEGANAPGETTAVDLGGKGPRLGRCTGLSCTCAWLPCLAHRFGCVRRRQPASYSALERLRLRRAICAGAKCVEPGTDPRVIMVAVSDSSVVGTNAEV